MGAEGIAPKEEENEDEVLERPLPVGRPPHEEAKAKVRPLRLPPPPPVPPNLLRTLPPPPGLQSEDLWAGYEDEAEQELGEAPEVGELEKEDSESELVEEHLKDAVEGSIRLKRILNLEAGESTGSAPKRRKVAHRAGAKESVRIRQLLQKWASTEDLVTQHVLEGMSMFELKHLHETNYTPDKYNAWKSPAELLAMHIASLREKSGPGGGPLDIVSAFKFRWKLDHNADKILRKLTHREIRHVLAHYDGQTPLEQVAQEAAACPQEEGNAIGSVVPEAPGSRALGRFHRLEIIDPVSEAAVFGDANLSFALNLAKHRRALGHVGRIVATTFEPLDTLQERYKEIDETIVELEEHLAEVYHGVDCTRIAMDQRFRGLEGTLGAVYYNFPHAGAISGFFDGHPLVNWRHENLMRLFFRALRTYVKPGGIVKVSSNMGAVGVRYAYIIESAMENEFTHVETVPFLEWRLHRYGRSYGDRRDAYKRPGEGQGYNVQRAEADMVYTFEYSPSGQTLPKQRIRMPPTFKTIQACPDGPFSNLHGEARLRLARDLYNRFVTEVSGVHVG